MEQRLQFYVYTSELSCVCVCAPVHTHTCVHVRACLRVCMKSSRSCTPVCNHGYRGGGTVIMNGVYVGGGGKDGSFLYSVHICITRTQKCRFILS